MPKTLYAVVNGALSMRAVMDDHQAAAGEVLLVGVEHTREDIIAALPAAAAAYALADRAPLIQQALAALDATDTVALRCWKAGVAYPADWATYTAALRAIVNGSDVTSTALPARPSYPAGT